MIHNLFILLLFDFVYFFESGLIVEYRTDPDERIIRFYINKEPDRKSVLSSIDCSNAEGVREQFRNIPIKCFGWDGYQVEEVKSFEEDK